MNVNLFCNRFWSGATCFLLIKEHLKGAGFQSLDEERKQVSKTSSRTLQRRRREIQKKQFTPCLSLNFFLFFLIMTEFSQTLCREWMTSSPFTSWAAAFIKHGPEGTMVLYESLQWNPGLALFQQPFLFPLNINSLVRETHVLRIAWFHGIFKIVILTVSVKEILVSIVFFKKINGYYYFWKCNNKIFKRMNQSFGQITTYSRVNVIYFIF